MQQFQLLKRFYLTNPSDLDKIYQNIDENHSHLSAIRQHLSASLRENRGEPRRSAENRREPRRTAEIRGESRRAAESNGKPFFLKLSRKCLSFYL